MSKQRLDHLLQQYGFARSRSHAQQIVKDGFVKLEGRVLSDPGEKFDPQLAEKIHVTDAAKYVSRGALKLLNALKRLDLDPRGLNCLDIGISTGGFSQVLLESGASNVTGIDVGKNQLSPKLLEYPNLKVQEGVNARNISSTDFSSQFDLILIDVSFISVTHILPKLSKLLLPQGKILALIKPQFELGPGALDKKGVVRNASLYKDLEIQIRHEIAKNGLSVIDYFSSEVKGGDGNTEFFCFASLKD